MRGGQTGGKVFMTVTNQKTHTSVVMRRQSLRQRLMVLSIVWHVVVHLRLATPLQKQQTHKK